MSIETADLLLDLHCALGEGPIWVERDAKLYWVDIPEGAVHWCDADGGDHGHVSLGQDVGTVVPRDEGGLAVALRHGFAFCDPAEGTLDMLVDPESDRPENRFNDGKCDPQGRFWAGTMGEGKAKQAGALYRLDLDGSVQRMIDGVSISNGLCWDRERKLFYFIDTPTFQVACYDYDPDSGAIANRRVVVEVPRDHGGPDGMVIDRDGRLWIAHWGGWHVRCWDPADGRCVHEIPVPAANVTACAFGGPELDRLYITTARRGQDVEALREQPHAGGLFVAKPGARGWAGDTYRG